MEISGASHQELLGTLASVSEFGTSLLPPSVTPALTLAYSHSLCPCDTCSTAKAGDEYLTRSTGKAQLTGGASHRRAALGPDGGFVALAL